jgi:excisionase family DNA binding protein
MEQIAYDLKESSVSSKLSVSLLRRAIKAGKLKVTRVGRRIVIPCENLKQFVQSGWTK